MFRLMSALFGLALVLGLTAQAYAFPLPKGPAAQFKAMTEIPPTFTANYNFEGIVALSNCSGSLIRLETSKDSDNALVLTNGHCYEGGMPDPGVVITNQPSSRTFDLLDAGSQSIGQVTATMVLYSTMTNTDITLYKLQETYADIKTQYNITPLTLASHPASLTDKIDVISGYWRRGYTCSVEKFVHQLKEDNWTMTDSIRYSRPGCETIGGTSGSPIVLAGTKTIIGINNTGNENGGDCTMNNPCEVDEHGNVFYEKGISYGQQTYWIYSCLDSNNNIDLGTRGCRLPH